jgi:hypothetical protein
MVAALAGFLPAFSARADECGEYQPTAVTVVPEFGEITYDHTQGMMAIRELGKNRRGGSGSNPRQWEVGLAAGRISLRVSSVISKLTTDEYACGQLGEFRVELGFINNVIYIASELPENTCGYATVLEHEQRHKEIDYALFEEYVEKAKDYFTRMTQDIGMVRQPTGASLEAQINAAIRGASGQFSDELEAERQRRQDELDSPEEYERVTKACNGEIAEIVHKRVGNRN